MTTPANQQFKIVAKITKHYLRKNDDGSEKYILEGMASNTKIDLTGERMADSAIEAMATSLETNKVYVNNEHRDGWDDDFGEVTKLWVNDDHELMMEAELDPDHFRTPTLIKALDKGKQLGLSIGGVVIDAAMEWFTDLGRKVMTYKDISLFHVAITGTPAVADTWVTPITKSVKDWKEPSMPKEDTKVEKTNEEVVETTAGESQAVETVTTDVDVPADEVVADENAKGVTDETPEKDVAEETPDVPAEGEESPEAPEQDTTEKSDAETGDKPADVEVDTVTDAETVDAAGKEDETAATVESPPDQAEAEDAEVEKKAIFDGYSQANVAEVSVRTLSEELSWRVWSAVVKFDEDDRTKDERKAFVRDALAEYSEIVITVASALIDTGIDGEPSEAEKQFVAPRAEEVAKSITALDEKTATLTTSLSDKDAELAKISKSLVDKTTELETTKQELTTKSGELVTAMSELTTANTQLETIKARKGIVFDKFAGAEATKGTDQSEIAEQAHRQFAGFIMNGAAKS